MSALTPTDMMARVAEIEQRAVKLCKDADRNTDDVKGRATALRELRQAVELLAKLSAYAIEHGSQEVPDDVRPDIDSAILAALAGRGAPTVGALTAGEDTDEAIADAEIVDG